MMIRPYGKLTNSHLALPYSMHRNIAPPNFSIDLFSASNNF